MWHLTACKISVSLSFLNEIKNEMSFYRINVANIYSIKTIKKKSFCFDPVKKCETNWIFTGCQMPRFMIVYYTINQFMELSLDKKLFFEEYGTFLNLSGFFLLMTWSCEVDFPHGQKAYLI